MPLLNLEGARLNYSRTGSGPGVLLVQGVGIVGEGWRPQIDALSASYTVIAFDNRGIGASTTDSRSLSIEQMALDALAIMDHEGIDRFHVVGHSMGGLIAIEIALRVPRRIYSLGLLCTFPDGPSATRLRWDTLVSGIRTRVGTRAMRRRAFLELVMPRELLLRSNDAALAGRLRPLFGRDLADNPPIIMRQLRAMSRYDTSPRLGELASIPTLVVSAMQDRISVPANGRRLAALIPGSALVELPNAAHGVPIHSPSVTNDLLEGLFERASAPVDAR
jgi:pimeloyl-ACP methyl ester carboxylesterase